MHNKGYARAVQTCGLVLNQASQDLTMMAAFNLRGADYSGHVEVTRVVDGASSIWRSVHLGLYCRRDAVSGRHVEASAISHNG